MKPPLTGMFAALLTTVAAWGADDWGPRGDVPYPVANLAIQTRWDPAKPLHLKISTMDDKKSVMLTFGRDSNSLTLAPVKAYPPSVKAGIVFTPASLPAVARADAEITVKFRPEFWAVYVDNHPAALLPAPFAPPARVLQPRAEWPSDKPPDPYLQKVADFVFQDDFLVPEDDKNKLAAWEKESGEWKLHTAADSSVERKNIAADALKKPEPERSPNFYSLKGQGHHALITAGYAFYDSYSVEAAVQTRPGEMGLAFYVQEEGGYHAFTLHMRENENLALLRLWKTADKKKVVPEPLAAATVPLSTGQWVKLRVVTFENRVRCFLDRTPVFDVVTELPSGGRFGLYADSETGIRFDDVVAKSNHHLDLTTVVRIRQNTQIEDGNFFGGRGFLPFLSGEDSERQLRVPAARKPQTLVLGSELHGPHVFAADVHFHGRTAAAGLLAGWSAPDRPFYRFVCRRDAKSEDFTLEQVTGKKTITLEHFALPAAAALPTDVTVRLMCDATNRNELRLYRDGALVLIHHAAAPVAGASGVWIGPGTAADVSNLDYAFERSDLYRNKFEKNRIFIEDPFMRHWSSPEGDWIDDPKTGLVWHKSDFYGRFLVRLPCVVGSQVHLGVDEGKTNGDVILLARDNELLFQDQLDLAKVGKPLPSVAVKDLANFDGGPKPENDWSKWYTLHYEGFWLWLTSGDRVLAKLALARPLHGHRIRIQGFTTDQLKNSYVERFNVKDFLFTESLHEWTGNGGSWEVVNRFQCTPSWSNMDGESKDTIAALWAKYRFRGDFCIEMYAGMRHGWYDRVGDLNLTVLNQDTTPSQGYTVTCAGWDEDHSQSWTRLFRDGIMVTRSDKYTMPRLREGSKRLGYEPLVQAGRDIHGAWYYIRFRRAGTRLEYTFDNETVFTIDDPAPLPEGAFGIWTFMNSMVVARVKIAAEGITPVTLPITPLAPENAAAALADKPVPAPARPLLLRNGAPFNLMTPDRWSTDDPVGRTTLTWPEPAGDSPYFVLRNFLGSGTLPACSNLSAVPYRDLAGWRFLLKRTPHAQFNFHYALGHVDGSGVFTAERQFFHRITGSDFAAGPNRQSGQTDVPPVTDPADTRFERGNWMPVTVWVAMENLRDLAADPTLMVKVTGFGNFQPCDVIQGLTGNGPGEGYAVKGFTEIRYSVPRFALPPGETVAGEYLVRLAGENGDRLRTRDLGELQKWVDGWSATGLVDATLTVSRNGSPPLCQPLMWARLPEKPELLVAWSTDQPHLLELRSALSCPDRRFAFADITVGTAATAFPQEAWNLRRNPLPRIPDLLPAKTPAVTVKVAAEGKSWSYPLAWNDKAPGEAPVLLGIEGLSPVSETFETRAFPACLDADASRMQIRSFDPEQGSYLEVRNAGAANRLSSVFRTPVNLARFPIVRCRYRASYMARITLGLNSTTYVRLGETYAKAQPVRFGRDWALDNRWHTWQGIVSDAITSGPLDLRVFTGGMAQFASLAEVDQTGLHSDWALDDLFFGPAIANKDQLAITPHYFDFDGVASVKAAVRSGPENYEDLRNEEITALAWQPLKNDAKSTLALGGLTPGVCHIYMSAVDPAGNISAVTDLPFLLDRTPPACSVEFAATDDTRYNGTELRLLARSDGGAPLDLEGIALYWDARPVPLVAALSRFSHTADSDTLGLNWPYIFRRQLDQAANGSQHKLTVTGLKDGAGNVAPNLETAWTVDYAKDKTGPTWLRLRYPANVLWTTAWEAQNATASCLTVTPARTYAVTALVCRTGEPSYLRATLATVRAELTHAFEKGAWRLDTFPYLAFVLRRPSIDDTERTRIELELTGSNGQEYRYALARPPRNPNVVAIPDLAEWQENVWYNVQVDVRDLLRRTLEKEELTKAGIYNAATDARAAPAIASAAKRLHELSIDSLKFRIVRPTPGYVFDVRTISVFAAWRPQDKIEASAFDVSGMAGLTWRGSVEKNVDGLVLAPAALPANERGKGWLELKARDKAGNLSWPVLIPVLDADGKAESGPPAAPATTPSPED